MATQTLKFKKSFVTLLAILPKLTPIGGDCHSLESTWHCVFVLHFVQNGQVFEFVYLDSYHLEDVLVDCELTFVSEDERRVILALDGNIQKIRVILQSR